jgi:dipeptidyl-peptidase-4
MKLQIPTGRVVAALLVTAIGLELDGFGQTTQATETTQATQATQSTQATQATQATSQRCPKPLTWEAIYGDDPVDFSGDVPRGMQWSRDGTHYYRRSDGKLERVDAQTGARAAASEVESLEATLCAHPDFDGDAARRLARNPGQWNEDRTRVLIRHQNAHYLYESAPPRVRRLTALGADYENVNLGPAGKVLCFTRDHDLYAIRTRDARQRRLTHGGKPTRSNGTLDWVYQEEVFGRGNWNGYWISADDRYVAYLQLDQADVPAYEIVREYEPKPSTEHTQYPKPGDPNPTARLGVVGTHGGRTHWADLSDYAKIDFLITQVSWSPDGRLIAAIQDRHQTWLDLLEIDGGNGRSRVLLRETSPAWIEPTAEPHWLDSGAFLWLSERDGYRHLYTLDRDGNLIRRLTRGTWQVSGILGVDEPGGWVYLAGTRDSVLESHAYRVPLAGGTIERITEPGFSHNVRFDPTHTYFFDTYSNITTPTRVALRAADGRLIRMISENAIAALDEYIWSRPKLVHLEARDGFPLHGLLIRPPDYDPARRYPVWCVVYGGPSSQTVRNRWAATSQLAYQLLTQQGYVVWLFDPRSGSGRGAVANWQVYARLGQIELRDIEDGIQWLIDTGVAEPSRIGLTGHSYGGYMTAYALTHSQMFKLGIAGAPVTDWRNYDTIYTERYMRSPHGNAGGYDAGSAVAGAENLHGRLLVVHGLLDDNVHFQNSAQLIQALQEHGKQFDLMVYPGDRHGISKGREHYRRLTYDYIREHL